MAAAHVVPDMLETCVDSGWAIALHCDSRATQQNMEMIGLLLVEHLTLKTYFLKEVVRACLADIYWVKGLNPRRMDGVCPNVYPHWMASYCRLRVAATTGARDRYRRGCVRECSDTRECGGTRGTTECEQQRARRSSVGSDAYALCGAWVCGTSPLQVHAAISDGYVSE